jgi:glycosyltransferase involved in cell wall biosynthesis
MNCLHISANKFPSIDKVNFTKDIWKELAKGFNEYHIVARSTSNRFEFFQDGKIFLHLVPKLGEKERVFILSSFFIFYLIPKYKITHLIAQSSLLGGITGALASRFFKIPMMVEIHGEQYFRYLNGKGIINSFYSSLIKFSFKTAKKVRSLNHFMTAKLNSIGIFNVVEIPNRVNFSLFNSKKENFQLSSPIRLISIGRFVKEKNYLKLIEYLYRSGFDFSLVLVGGGPLKSEYVNLLEDLRIKNRVELVDWVKQDDLHVLVSQSDIYIQYSTSEGMPRTIIEAMALRMPIITTNVGSIAGVIENLSNGILVDVNDFVAFGTAISTLTSNDALRENLANQAFLDAKKSYEWNSVFEKYRFELVNLEYANS